MWVDPAGLEMSLDSLVFTDQMLKILTPKEKRKNRTQIPPLKTWTKQGLQSLAWVLYRRRTFVEKEREIGLEECLCPTHLSLCLWVYVAPPRTYACACPSAAHSTLACLALAHASVI